METCHNRKREVPTVPIVIVTSTKLVVTLTLGSWLRQGCGPRRMPRNHISCSRECRRMWGMTLTLPSEFPLWELESQWTIKSSKSNFRDQNALYWGFPYIIEKILKHKCLKWACMTHLDTSNTSYGQKKGWESNCQFDSRPLKVNNRPNFLMCGWHVTYR